MELEKALRIIKSTSLMNLERQYTKQQLITLYQTLIGKNIDCMNLGKRDLACRCKEAYANYFKIQRSRRENTRLNFSNCPF